MLAIDDCNEEVRNVVTTACKVNIKKNPERIDLVTPEPKINENEMSTHSSDLQILDETSNDALKDEIESGLTAECVLCTACSKKLNIKKRKICRHSKLGALVCKTCLNFISSNEFTRDEMGIEEYCTWCGDGGNLVCCDFCEKAYCKYCVKRNLGKEFLKALLEADDEIKWKCFCCDRNQIQSFIKECDIVMKYIEELNLKNTLFTSEKKNYFDKPEAERAITIIPKPVKRNLADSQKIRRNSEDDPIKNMTSESSRGRIRKKVSYNEQDMHQKAVSQAEQQLDSSATKALKKTKKQTVIILTSDDEDSDDEVIIVTKDGKRKVLSKHVILAAQAALEKKSSKEQAKNNSTTEKKPRSKKKLNSFLRVSFNSKKLLKDTSSSSMDEDENENDEEEESKVKEKEVNADEEKDNLNSDCVSTSNTVPKIPNSELKETPSTVKTDEDGFKITLDDQQPGPSGVRPKNKMQIRRQQLEKSRGSSSSDSDIDEAHLKAYRQRTIRQRQNAGIVIHTNDSTKEISTDILTLDGKTIQKEQKDDSSMDSSKNVQETIFSGEVVLEKKDMQKTVKNDDYQTQKSMQVVESEKVNTQCNQNVVKELQVTVLKYVPVISTEVENSTAALLTIQNTEESAKKNPKIVSDNQINDVAKDNAASRGILKVENCEDSSDDDVPLTHRKRNFTEIESREEVVLNAKNSKTQLLQDIETNAGKRKLSVNSSDPEENEASKSKRQGVKKRRRIRMNSLSSIEKVSSSEEDSNYKGAKVGSSSSASSSDGSVIIRRSKRQQRLTKKKTVKKKKTVANSSGDDDNNDENGTPSNNGRRKIRRILKDHELNEETRHARKVEEQRRKRLLERTKEDREETQHVLEEVDGDFVLERNEKKEPLITVHADINVYLKPHQRKGVQFMYDCVIETIKSYKKGDPGNGCLLAHCMGLGKTLQVVAFIHTVKKNRNIEMQKFLVVAPLNTVLNWEQEFEKWLPEAEKIRVFVLSYCNDSKERLSMIRQWYEEGGVIITGYEMYRNLVNYNFIRSKKMKDDIKRCLVDPGPDIVICDEGHVLRNNTSAISKAMNAIKTKRRIVLTGTPLQNNLPEYHVMVDFIKPMLLGTRKEFQNRFVNPIHNGQCSNSTSYDVRIMKQRSHVLYQLLSGCVQRLDYSVLSPFLPQKREYTIFVRLSEKQMNMYQYYLENFVYKDDINGKWRSNSLFSDFQCLARIWTHPWAFQIDREKQEKRNMYKDDSMDEFIDDEGDSEGSSPSEDEKPKPWTIDTSSDEETSAARRRKRRKEHFDDTSSSDEDNDGDNDEDNSKLSAHVNGSLSKRSTRTRSATAEKSNSEEKGETEKVHGSLRSGINFKDSSLNPEREEKKVEFEKEWYDDFVEEGDESNITLSGKLVLLFEILSNAEVVGDKVLVFSQSLTSLDLIETCLGNGIFEGTELSWCHGVDYFRMDGSTSVQQRKRWSDIFNDPENTKCRLFLISTKAGSLGINMVAANRVVIFDCSWNPSHDVQSVFRVYRFGQEKPVYVYRLIAQGTMEEKVYGRQINKLAVSGRVVDEMQIERHFTDEEVRELYTFTPEPIKEGETPVLPKDPLLAEVLQRQHPKYIARYHEHDLLLKNVESEELSEEERKQAWKSYEDEKDNAARAMAFRQQAADFQQLYNQQQTDVMTRISGLNGIASTIRVPSIPPNLPPEHRARLEIERANQIKKAFEEIRAQQHRANVIASHTSQVRNSNDEIRLPISNNSDLLRLLPLMGAQQILKIPGIGNYRVTRNPSSAQLPHQQSSVYRLPSIAPNQDNASSVENFARPSRYDIPEGWRSEISENSAAQNKRPSRYDVPNDWKK